MIVLGEDGEFGSVASQSLLFSKSRLDPLTLTLPLCSCHPTLCASLCSPSISLAHSLCCFLNLWHRPLFALALAKRLARGHLDRKLVKEIVRQRQVASRAVLMQSLMRTRQREEQLTDAAAIAAASDHFMRLGAGLKILHW